MQLVSEARDCHFGKPCEIRTDHAEAEVDRLRSRVAELESIISEPVQSFGTPELVAWAEKLQRILADFPEEERGELPFVFTMGDHLEKFAKSWNSPMIAALQDENAGLRAENERLLAACDGYKHDVIYARAEIGKIAHTNASLRAALEPFAKMAEAFDPSDVFSDCEIFVVKRSDAMEARAALGGNHPETPDSSANPSETPISSGE